MKEETLQRKEQAVAEVVDKMKRAQCMVIVDYRGLTVDEVTKLRKEFREADVEYRVIKNNMLRRAAESLEIEGVNQYFVGPTAVAFGYDDPVTAAKILVNFKKTTDKIEIKGGVLDGLAIDVAKVTSLSKLPGKEELLAKMLGSLNAPITNFALALAAVPKGLAVALGQIVEKKEQDPNAFADVTPGAAKPAEEATPAEETAGEAPAEAPAEEVPAEEADSEKTEE